MCNVFMSCNYVKMKVVFVETSKARRVFSAPPKMVLIQLFIYFAVLSVDIGYSIHKLAILMIKSMQKNSCVHVNSFSRAQ